MVVVAVLDKFKPTDYIFDQKWPFIYASYYNMFENNKELFFASL